MKNLFEKFSIALLGGILCLLCLPSSQLSAQQYAYSKATKNKNVKCPSGSFFDPIDNGTCWSCPSGYKRTVFSIKGDKACERAARMDYKKAVDKGKGSGFLGTDCPRGAFLDPNGRCYTCPSGYKRTVHAVTSGKACEKRIAGGMKRALRKSKLSCGSGTFFDLIDGGSCWSCPKDYKRTSYPVKHQKACRKTVSTSSSANWSPKSWMKDLKNTIGTKVLHKISIPGTHDSGAYSSRMLNAYVRTQSQDLGRQLNDGMRYLNLELSIKGNIFYFTHNTTYASDLLVLPQLQKIKQFATDNPEEMIILDFQELWGQVGNQERMSKANQQKLVNYINQIFGASIIKKEELQGLKKSTLFNLQQNSLNYRNRGKGSHNVIVLWNYNDRNTDYPTKFIGRYDYLQQTYNSGGNWGDFVAAQIKKLITDNEAALKTADANKMQLIPFLVNSANMRDDARRHGIKNALIYAPKWKADSNLKDKVNIIMVDHYDQNPSFIKDIVNLNTK